MSDTKKKKPSKPFENIIGQQGPIKKLEFWLDSYKVTRFFPNMIFAGAKGQGKSTLGKETAKGLIAFNPETGKPIIDEETGSPKRKTYIEINCSTIKNIKQFINSTIIPFVQDKDVTLLFDEAHNIPRDVTNGLLTILNPNPEHRTTFAFDEYVCEFDFHRQTFLFATSEIQAIFPPLLDRLRRIDLEDYTHEQLAKIVQRGAKEVKFEGDVLQEISGVLRGNARAGQKMADDIKTYLKGGTKFGPKDWEAMKDIFEIHPLGLNSTEIKILRILADNPDGTPLRALAAKTGLSTDAVQKDYEMYLHTHGLMSIETTGRQITAKGLEYLRGLLRHPVFRSQRVAQKP